MTKTEQLVLEKILDFINENEYPPSVRELCNMMGVSSPATIHHHLKNMKKKGIIDYKEKASRTIKILI